MEVATDKLLQSCKALSNEFRRSLVLYIVEWYPDGASISELAQEYDRSPQYISHNLVVLVEAGLLSKDTKTKRYFSSDSWSPEKLFSELISYFSKSDSASTR